MNSGHIRANSDTYIKGISKKIHEYCENDVESSDNEPDDVIDCLLTNDRIKSILLSSF